MPATESERANGEIIRRQGSGWSACPDLLSVKASEAAPFPSLIATDGGLSLPGVSEMLEGVAREKPHANVDRAADFRPCAVSGGVLRYSDL